MTDYKRYDEPAVRNSIVFLFFLLIRNLYFKMCTKKKIDSCSYKKYGLQLRWSVMHGMFSEGSEVPKRFGNHCCIRKLFSRCVINVSKLHQIPVQLLSKRFGDHWCMWILFSRYVINVTKLQQIPIQLQRLSGNNNITQSRCWTLFTNGYKTIYIIYFSHDPTAERNCDCMYFFY